jgi:ribonuclease HI
LQGVITIYTDGASRKNPGPSASGYMAYRDGKIVARHFSYNGVETNNYAEYRAVILALEWCRDNLKDPKETEIRLYSDSELVIKQVNGKYKVKSGKLMEMNRVVKSLLPHFKKLEFMNTGREDKGIDRVDRQLNALLDRMEKIGVQERYKLDNGQTSIKVD